MKKAFDVNPVVALLGPSQCGKSTLAIQYLKQIKGETHFFDLENPTDLAQFENPILTLEGLNGLIVIDEIQRLPNLFPYIRTLVDKKREKLNFFFLALLLAN